MSPSWYVLPGGFGFEHGIQDGKQLVHGGDDGDLAVGAEAVASCAGQPFGL